MLLKNLYYINYTWQHKKAFLRLEKKLLGYNTLRGYLHDLDKLIMYLVFTKELSTKIHRTRSRHHNRVRSERDYKYIMIDWECSRFTKLDKPYTAREYLNDYRPDMKDMLEPLLDEHGL